MRRRSSNATLYLVLIIVLAIMAVLNPTRFLRVRNFYSMAYQLPFLAFLAMGQMVPIVGGGINLAIVATANFTGIITAMLLRALSGGSPLEASTLVILVSMLGGVLAALLAGALSGFLIGYLRVPDILATLGTMILLNGVNIVLTKGYTLTGFPDALIAIGNGVFLGIPIPFWLFLAIAVVFRMIMERSVFGYQLYMIGSSYTASRFAGINTRSVIMGSYLLSSLFAAITAFVMMGQLNSVKANYAESYLLVSVLACFLGGVDPLGGDGRVSGLVLAVMILQVISTGVNLMRMDPFFILAMWGFIVLVIIAANHLSGRFRLQRPLRGLGQDSGLADG
ncbi:MAG: ABC transporter permease [Firmicutes bacterium]|nr:ABC transporter permease [Bacillota bacterium]